MRLKDLKCVVTGGASGVGAATVRRFAAEGAEVCILDNDLSSAEALAAELGGRAFCIRAGCADGAGCRAGRRRCARALGGC